mgnify:CR=1 FL=1
MVGIGAHSSTSNVALWRELKVPPIAAMAAARRARAWCKGKILQTWLRTLNDTRFVSRCRTWISGTQVWLRTNANMLLERVHEDPTLTVQPQMNRITQWTQLDPKQLAARIQLVVWEREERCFPCVAATSYIEDQYMEQPLFRIGDTHHPTICGGLNQMLRMRINGFWTARHMANCNVINSVYKTTCPFCLSNVPEDLFHLLWTCTRWNVERAKWVLPLREKPALSACFDNRPVCSAAVVALTLGGKRNDSKLANFSPQGPDTIRDLPREGNFLEVDAEEGRDDGVNYEVQVANPEDGLCCSYKVARFLVEIRTQRTEILRGLPPL